MASHKISVRSSSAQIFVVVPTGRSVLAWGVAHVDDPTHFLSKHHNIISAIREVVKLTRQYERRAA